MTANDAETVCWVRAARIDDVEEDEPAGVVVNGVEVALFKDGDDILALSDRCTHGDARLSEGYVEDGCVECPLHQALFDLATGEVRAGPATEGVRAFRVRIESGDILVGL